jgi:hypothetical protein
MAVRNRRLSYRGKSQGEILGMYPKPFRDCRTNRHSWSPRAIYTIVSAGVRERTEVCPRCAATRSFLIDNSGHRLDYGRRRHSEPGYLVPRSGLVQADFAAGAYNEDFEKALTEGRVRASAADDNVTQLHSAS